MVQLKHPKHSKNATARIVSRRRCDDPTAANGIVIGKKGSKSLSFIEEISFAEDGVVICRKEVGVATTEGSGSGGIL